MNLAFENLNKIDDILEKLEYLDSKISSEKRWLSTSETSEYLGYSKNSIDAMVKSGEFILGHHYYQRARKRIFDREILDKWVLGLDFSDCKTDFNSRINETIKDITDSVTADI